MQIAHVEAIPVEVPMAKPLKMAIATVTARTCVIVRIITSDGTVGVGEGVIATYFTGETLGSACQLVEDVWGPILIGRDATDLHAITHDMDRVASGNTAARSAVEIALFDLLGKAHGVPLHQLFGGRVRETVPTIWHLSGGDAKATAEDAVRAQKEGFELFKVKVGTGTLDEDVARVCAVREAVGPEGSLLLDANQGWTVEEAVLFCRQVEPQRPTLIEQPVHRADVFGMARVQGSTPIVIAVDEGVYNARELHTHLTARAASGVIGKLVKAGGLEGVRQLAAVAAASGIGMHFAGMAGETSIAAAAALQLACSLPELRHGSGISPHYLTDDVVSSPLRPVDGHYEVPQAPGIGVELDDAALKRLRVSV